MNNLFDKKTEILTKEIEKNKNYQKLDYKKDDPIDFILTKKAKLNISNKEIAYKLNKSEAHVSRILSGARHKRDNFLAIGLILSFSLDEINQVLKYLDYNQLYVKNERDSILIHGFMHEKSIDEINTLLGNNNQDKLY